MTRLVQVDPEGLLRLPAQVLERHGLALGGDVIVRETSEGIVIQTVSEAVRQAQDWSRSVLAGQDKVSVADFIADRRRHAIEE